MATTSARDLIGHVTYKSDKLQPFSKVVSAHVTYFVGLLWGVSPRTIVDGKNLTLDKNKAPWLSTVKSKNKREHGLSTGRCGESARR